MKALRRFIVATGQVACYNRRANINTIIRPRLVLAIAGNSKTKEQSLMRVMKRSVIALAVAAVSQCAMASEQSESQGLVEDSTLNVLTRLMYFNRDFRGSHFIPTINGVPQDRADATGLGVIGVFESGFTSGPVGIGFDVIGMHGSRLDGGRGHAPGTGMFPIDSDGAPAKDLSKAGAVVKARVSNTTVKYGTQIVHLPVFSTDDTRRLLPETATGTLVTSKELNGLTLNAGHFTALNTRDANRSDSGNLLRAKVLGGVYELTDDLSVSLYTSDVDLRFAKHYGNVKYDFALGESQALGFDFNIYRTNYDKQYTGTGQKEENTIWSLATAYSFGAHAVTVAYQKSIGGFDGIGYDYGMDGDDTVWLANSVQRSDFNAEDEKSWQLRYDLDFAEYGVPGLHFMTRYVRGWGAFTFGPDKGKEWERDVEVGYRIQSGAAKDLNLMVRQATYRSTDGIYYGSSSIDEIQLILEYPLSLL